jgi:hypothetical protein
MTVKAAQITVGTIPVLLTGADLDHRDGSSIAIQAPAAANMYIGGDNTVSASTGWQVAAGQTLALDLEPGEPVYGVLMSGTGTAFVLRTGV